MTEGVALFAIFLLYHYKLLQMRRKSMKLRGFNLICNRFDTLRCYNMAY